MGSFSNRASPVFVLPPQSALHSFGMDPTNSPFSNPSPFGHASPDLFSSQPNTPSLAGRKRSRDESNIDEETYFTAAPIPEPVSEEGWEYGEGMTLIRPNGFIIDASSQTGTWADEKIPTPPVLAPVERPMIRSFKSQRLDLTATPAIEEEVTLSNGVVTAHSPPKLSMEPTVDDFTIHLGIGWSRISEDTDIQAAARGWAKYIENHFPVSYPEIRLQSKGLASYLVEAAEGWFLFGEDLKQGRLVSVSLDRAFVHLRSNPPVFDGSVIMEASSPMANSIDVAHGVGMNESTFDEIALMNGMNGRATNGHNVEDTMDMS